MVQNVNVVDKDIDQSTIVRGGSNVYQIRGKDLYVYRPDVVKKGNEGSVIKKASKRIRYKIETEIWEFRTKLTPNAIKGIRSSLIKRSGKRRKLKTKITHKTRININSI
jgi:hypothetical protein